MGFDEMGNSRLVVDPIVEAGDACKSMSDKSLDCTLHLDHESAAKHTSQKLLLS